MRLREIIDSIVEDKVNDAVSPIWVAVPGQVESVNRQSFTCNVYLQMDPDSLYIDIPIMPIATGKCAIYMPLEVDDAVLVFAGTSDVSATITTRNSPTKGLGGRKNFTPEFVIPLGRFSEDDGDVIYKDEVREVPLTQMKLVSENGIYLCAPGVLVSDLVIEDVRLLPTPTVTHRGKMHRIQGDDDMIVVCMNKGGTFVWQKVVMENPPFGQLACNFTVS